MTAPHAVGTDDGPADLAGLARPRRLAHPARLYAVVGGTARPTGQRHFLADLPAGVAVFGMAAPGVTFLLADGRSAARPPAFSDDPIDPAGIEAWHAALLSFVADSQDTVDALADALLLHAGERCAVTAGTRMTARSLTWLQADAPVLRYPGQANGVPLLVVTERVFAEPIADAAVEAIDTAPLVGKVDIAAVAQCSQHLAGRLAGALIGREEVEAERRARIVAIDGAEASRVLRQLREFYRGPPPVPPARPQDSALAHALAAIATVEGFVLRLPPPPPREVALFDRLRDFAGTSGFRFREIALEPGWWREEGPAFLGVEAGAERPLALVWHRGHWRTMGAEGERVVDASVAATLLPRGYLLYPSLPGRIAAGDMLRFALSGVGGEVKRLLLAALATALASLLLPVATGAIVGSAIPQDRPGLLYDMLLLLASAAVGGALFRIVRAFALIRLGTRIDRRLQAAVWDRVIRLPAAFFRGYPTGDLALRVLGVDGIRRILSAATVSAAIGAIFSLISFAVMLFYDARLTAFAAFYAAIAASLMLVIGRRQMVIERDLTQRNGILSGLLVDLLGGMSKVRVAAAELRGFRRWADAYIQQRINIGRGSRQASLQAALASSLPVLGTAGIFLIAAEAGDPVGVGDFAAFIGAFGQFTEAMMGLSAAVNVGVEVIPLYARLRPVLDAPLEAAEDRIDPGTLGGRIAVRNLSFRYDADGPWILRDLDFEVRPGEWVAIVGASGSGKSTILRLLLGFERATQGGVYYDDEDLERLDPRRVRAQIGTVMQTFRLLPGSLRDNIAGSAPVSRAELDEAVRLASLDADIAAMPMGLDTFVTDGSQLSGGQRQRVMLARALIRKPRLLLLDEATSALDNRNQAAVSANIASLKATRIVIAHRLSSIRRADRILVLDNGRIAETGTFNELMARQGVFYRLAERQLV